jgi:hypothetical protein
MDLAILGIGLGQAGTAGHAGTGGQPGGFAAAAAKPSLDLFEYIVVTTMYRIAIQIKRRYFIYTLFETVKLRRKSQSVYIPIEETAQEAVMDAAEYERRKVFCESLKTMSRSEFIEIARILRKNNVVVSENRSGVFFDLCKISVEVFEELLVFRDFVKQNNTELEKRSSELVSSA